MRKVKYLIKRIVKLDYKNMWKIVGVINSKTKKNKLLLFCDIVYCGFKYQAGYYDYLEFEFYYLNKEQRNTFLTRGLNNEIVRKYNNKDKFVLFDDKVKFNEIFDKYLKREWLLLNDINSFKKFVKNKKKIIVKPIDGVGGVGIEIISINSKTDILELYDKLIFNKQLLIESVIKQHEDLNKLYDKSVNTIRMFTFYKEGKVYYLNGILKLGNGGVVDNFSSGGMYTFLNEDGVVIIPAIDRDDNIIDTHPVSLEKIVGFKVPMYKEAIALVKKAAKEIKDVQYVGWDVAISDDGPVIVEGNCFPGVFQIKASLNEKKEGVLPMYRKYMDI